MGDYVRKLAGILVISAVLTQVSYAQRGLGGPPGQTPESASQKAEDARHRAEQKATDEAYKATLKRLPASNKPIDPWGNIRTPADSGSK
jgi:hypothetical protein